MRSDLISRQAAVKEVETRLKAAYVWYDNSVLKDDYALSVKAEGAISALIECVLMLKGLPSAQPEPKRMRGKWQEHKDYPNVAYLCSECGHFTTMRTNFCPSCGVDMRGEQE